MKYGTTTENIHLLKPDNEDNVLISDFNENSDRLDSKLKQIMIDLGNKASISNPILYGDIQITQPGSDNIYNLGKAATTDYVDKTHIVYKMIAYNTRNDLPDKGEEGYIYILKDENDNPELIWNGSEYIEKA